MLRNTLLVSIFLLSSIISTCQQSAVFANKNNTYNTAVDLYNNGQFLAAQSLFATINEETDDETIKSDCAYYIANCAVKLNQQNADLLMVRFVEEHPGSIKRNNAFIDVANYYFENGKYSYARKWYDKVDENGLSNKDFEKFQFNNGYTYYKNKRYDEAKKHFNRVSSSESYGSEAKYYLGFIAYEGDDYVEANELFEEVKNEERYHDELSYYQADMNFKLGNFQKAIDLALEQYERSKPREKSELSKIIGESYFNLSAYSEAIPYLKEYKGKKGKWNNTDHYQLGYAYYKQNDFENAINEFNKIVDGNNDIAQNAYYHLAESYLKLDKKQQALNAFKNASEMSFNKEIQEDSALNYAKLSYEIGNGYKSVPEVILDFIKNYPDNSDKEELNNLLIDSYISSGNYRSAIELLEKNKSNQHKEVYQKVAFFRGMELYSEGNYHDAVTYFKKSVDEPHNAIFSARATYWLAESYYHLSQYKKSLSGYKQFIQLPGASDTREYDNVSYHLAYSEFKLKHYSEAIDHFINYSNYSNARSDLRTDAYLRIADGYFVTSRYWPAIENYNKVIELGSPNEDYAQFQKAMSYGLVDRDRQKVDDLKDLITTYSRSVYRDDALYELGNTYGSQNNTEKAIKTYDQLIKEIPTSGLVAKALLKKALILNNTGKSKEALSMFKRVANDFSSSSEALQAVASAKIIYIDQGRVKEYASWVRTLDFIDLDDNELDDATYLAAEQPFLENKTNQAISGFESYIEQFPKGKHKLKAHFYLAQLYFSEQNSDDAIINYEYVITKERNEFTEQALSRISQLYLEREDYKNALRYLVQLEKEADFPQNIIFAQTNCMKATYELERYSEAVEYAEKVLNNSKIDLSIKNDAKIIIARSAIKTGDMEKARTAYREVSERATGRLAAEAMYYKAYFSNQEGNYEESNNLVQTLAKEYSGYQYFGAKGLILMADNFYKLKDSYQAAYILESVIKNFSNYPELIDEAKKNLTQIKENESRTNSSVEVEDGN